MKFIKQTLLASLALVAATSFATSSQTGLDPAGDGVIHVTGTAVSSCAAPTLTVAMGNIDFHTAINGTLGTHEEALSLPVTCTNPNQNWTILPAWNHIDISGGHANDLALYVNGQMEVTNAGGYVAVVSPTSTAGSIMSVADGVSGVGTQTVAAKAIFGKEFAAGAGNGAVHDASLATGDVAAWFTARNWGIPQGTIDNRGAFSVDVSLVIMY